MQSLQSEIRHVTMMEHPERWPNVWCLPLRKASANRRPGDFPYELGLLLRGHGPVVHLRNMFDPPGDCETVSYSSFSAIVADGWEVD